MTKLVFKVHLNLTTWSLPRRLEKVNMKEGIAKSSNTSPRKVFTS